MHGSLDSVFVTGFGPFRSVVHNSSAAVAPLLGFEHRILDVTFEAIEEFLATFPRDRRRVLMLLGHSSFCVLPQLECLAKNFMGELCDNQGVQFGPGPIDPAGPNQRAGTLWRKALTAAPDDEFEVSTDAGKYLCNYLYYRALAEFPDWRVGFLHLPPLDVLGVGEQARRAQSALEWEFPGQPR